MNKGRGLWHGILMLICCLVPMLLLVTFFTRGTGAAGGGFGWLFLLLCPLMHIFMMKGMMGGHKHDEDKDGQDENSCDKTK